jgi:mono/diheme cytochrome c family protein
MYRGIIQHKAFLTDYLKKEIKERNLTLPLSLGRIYKVVPKDKNEEKVTITKDLVRLMELLKNGDGWARNQARQMLIDGKYVQAAPALRDALKTPGNPTVRVHLLWAMEGLGVLQLDDVLPLLKGGEWPVRLQALSVLPSIISKSNYKQVVPALNEMVQKSDTLAAPYVAFLGHYFRGYDTRFTDKLLMDLVSKYPTDKYIADAVISSLKNREVVFYKQLASRNTDTGSIIYKRLRTVTDDIVKTRNNKNIKQLEKQYPKGVALYQTNCQPCHGPDGNGVRALGPPLNNSNWVVGDKSKLISIVLYGLTGPVKVGDKLYTVPEISGEMPAIGQNKEVKDSDIAQILSFIRNSWNNKADIIDSVDVINIRNKFKGRQKAFTMEELNKQ